MTGDDRVRPRGGRSCDAGEGGYTIVLSEGRVASFFEAGDFSSAAELGHFTDVGAQIDARVRESGARSLLALSVREKSVSRDFAALQIAHVLAKLGRNVLLVDCDFMHPGLSGLVENVEEHGFLDLLLYGSSLKSVAHPVGIDGVSVAGPGSFPVSRTIPFALKEFDKIRDFLRTKHDVVIYCSTLRAEDGAINPLGTLVDGILLCCRLEQMDEGELQQSLKDLGSGGAPPVDVVCFCGEKSEATAAPAGARERPAPRLEEPASAAPMRPAATRAIPVIEKTAEPFAARKRPRFSILRVLLMGAAAVVVVFIVWWLALNRTVREATPQRPATGVALEREDTSSALGVRQAGRDTSAPAVAGGAVTGTTDTGAAAETKPAERVGIPVQSGTGAPSATAAAPIPADAKYTIHVASFNETFRAEVEKKYLDDNGYPARIVEVDLRGEKWLRVLVGAFATKAEADTARVQLLSLKRIGYARVVKLDEALR